MSLAPPKRKARLRGLLTNWRSSNDSPTNLLRSACIVFWWGQGFELIQLNPTDPSMVSQLPQQEQMGQERSMGLETFRYDAPGRLID